MGHVNRQSGLASYLVGKLGIDFVQLMAILNVRKAILNSHSLLGGAVKQSPLNKYGLLAVQMALYFISGLLACIGLLFESTFTGLILSHTFIMFILTMTFFLRFAGVLLDTSENQILFPRPVSGRTILAARLIHVGYHMSLLSIATGLPCTLALAYIQGPMAGLIFLLSLAPALALLMVFTQLAYFFIGWFGDPRKVQTFLVYFLSVALTLAITSLNFFIQNINEMLDVNNLRSIHVAGNWLNFYPPAWMAALTSLYLDGINKTNTILASCAVFVPAAGMFLSLYLLGAKYNMLLSTIDTAPTEREANHGIGKLIHTFFSSILFKTKSKKAIFDFVNHLMRTDHAFKLRVFPTYGVILAFFGMFIMQNRGNSLAEVFESGLFILYLYLVTCFVSATVTFIQYGAQYKASWIYQTLPLQKPGELVSTTIIAFIIRFVLPLQLIVIFLCSALWGFEGAVNALFACFVAVFVCFLQSYRIRYFFPFSQDIQAQSDGGKMMLDQFSIALPIIFLALAHAALKHLLGHASVALGCAVLMIVIVLFYRRLDRMSWGDVKSKNGGHVS